jgi:hypothetical protein
VGPGALESILAELPFFSRLREDERVRIAQRFRRRELAPRGEVHSIDPAHPELVIVLEGEARLEPAGTPLFAGDVLGQVEVVIGQGNAGKVTAVEPTILAVLDTVGLEALFADYPAIAPAWVAELARELKWRNDMLREVSLARAEGLPKRALEQVLERRKRRLARHRASPVRRATARVFSALFVVPGARPSFWMLLGALSALITARTVVAMIIRNNLQQHLFALIGGKVGHPIHVHHFNYGLLLVSLVGLLALLPRVRRALFGLAFTFGFGLGLIVDEFALLWNLNPDYYQPSSRLAAGAVILLLVQVVYFRGLYRALFGRLVSRVRG